MVKDEQEGLSQMSIESIKYYIALAFAHACTQAQPRTAVAASESYRSENLTKRQ